MWYPNLQGTRLNGFGRDFVFIYNIFVRRISHYENWHFSKMTRFQRNVYAMLRHSVGLPVSSFRYASTS